MTSVRTAGALLLLILVAGVLPAASGLAAEGDQPGVDWLSYREAMAAGQGQDKPILIHFTGPSSGICRKMMRETYNDKRVYRYLNEYFAATMIDVGEVPSLARKFKVESVPVLWFLDASGKPLTSIAGEVGPDKMLRVTEYINKKIYEHTDYETWLDKRSRK